jgi:heme-degrading monooxygenase HmoA
MTHHVIKTVTARADTTVPFPIGAPAVRSHPKVRRFFRLRKKAEGFVGHERTLSEDKLTMTQITTWESLDAAKAFRQKHRNLVTAAFGVMKRYGKKRGMLSRSVQIGPDGAEIVPAPPSTPAP